jgi:myosin heavy subunit
LGGVQDAHKANPFFPKVHKKDERDHFAVLHFAGPVKYRVSGWVLKNSDPLPEAMAATFAAATKTSLPTMPALLACAPELAAALAATTGEGMANPMNKAGVKGGGGKGGGGRTVCASFVASMKALTVQLSATKCNFIR